MVAQNNVAFHELIEDDFPFTIKFISQATAEVVHEIHVDGPGAVEVPGLAAVYGPVNVEIYWPDGTVEK